MKLMDGFGDGRAESYGSSTDEGDGRGNYIDDPKYGYGMGAGYGYLNGDGCYGGGDGYGNGYGSGDGRENVLHVGEDDFPGVIAVAATR